MAKKVAGVVKLQLPAGKATPAPPVGPALGGYGINIMAFVKEYNEKTASQAGSIIPVEITIFSDRSFTFVMKTPPAAARAGRAKDVRPQRHEHRGRREDHRRHRTEHGHCDQRLIADCNPQNLQSTI